MRLSLPRGLNFWPQRKDSAMLNPKQIAVLRAGVSLCENAEASEDIAASLEVLASSVMEMVLGQGGNVRGTLHSDARQFLSRRQLRDELAYHLSQRQEVTNGQAHPNGTVERPEVAAAHAAIDDEDSRLNDEVAERETRARFLEMAQADQQRGDK